MADNRNELVPTAKDVSDTVLTRINDMVGKQELRLPEGYNAGTALRSAMLTIQDTLDKTGRCALEVCTKASVVNALLNMCIQGLQPSKKQCYFIAYGNQLQLFRSYFGTQSALRRAVPSVHKVVADLIREGDQVEWATSQYGERYIAKIVTDPLQNYGKPYRFGFCNIYDNIGNLLAATLMGWDEIQTSWKQSRNYRAENGVHQKFPEEMAKRTLINRACKNILNSSAESDPVVTAAFNQTTDAEYERVEAGAKEEKKSLKERYQIGGKKQELTPEPQPEPEPEPEDPEDFDDDGYWLEDDTPDIFAQAGV